MFPNVAGADYKCKMRYGVAVGAVITGVLQGKCPTFDAYGKTVKLASVMEVWEIFFLLVYQKTTLTKRQQQICATTV